MTLTHQDLAQFTGTTTYFYLPLLRKFHYTEGVRYLAQQAGAYWLLEQIFLLQQEPELKAYCQQKDFQVWTLTKEKGTGEAVSSAFLICEDGNNNEVYREHIAFTDFPLDSIELWLEGSVLLLPSEH